MNRLSVFFPNNKKQFTRATSVALVMMLLVTLVAYAFKIDGHSLGDDAGQNIRSAVNLARFGVYGEGPILESVQPGFRREPFPNIMLAYYLKLWQVWLPGLLHNSDSELSGKLLFFSKTLNLVFAASLFGGCWVMLRQVFTSPLVANLAMMILLEPLSSCFVLSEVNNFNTELVASGVIVWLTVALIASAEQSSYRLVCACGLLFGCLALTKASAAYVALLCLPCLAYMLSKNFRQFWIYFLCLSIGFATFVLPWVLRNYLNFDSPVIAQGGGDVLLIRSEFNTMNDTQLRNGFYAYSPKYLQAKVFGPIFGLNKNDFECGNSLQVFNRKLKCDKESLENGHYDEVRSFYQRGKRGIPRKFNLKTEDKKDFAVERIKENPSAHVRTTLLMFWRGYWPFRSSNFLHTFINLMSFLSLALVPIIGFYEKCKSWISIGIVHAIYYLFYALTSHFLPRYSEPLIPLSLVCLSILSVYIGTKISSLRALDCLDASAFNRQA